MVLDFDPLGFSSSGRRETGAVLAAYPPTPKGLWSGFCVSTTNHKLRLMINSCSFSVPGSTRQLASACDLATVSISNKTDKKRTQANTFARLSHYLTFMTLGLHKIPVWGLSECNSTGIAPINERIVLDDALYLRVLPHSSRL